MRVEFTIKQIANVHNTELVGRPDPYVSVTIGDSERKTSTRKGTTTEFNETLIFEDVPDNSASATIRVYDKERVGKDDLMGEAIFRLSQLLTQPFSGDVELARKGRKEGTVNIYARSILENNNNNNSPPSSNSNQQQWGPPPPPPVAAPAGMMGYNPQGGYPVQGGGYVQPMQQGGGYAQPMQHAQPMQQGGGYAQPMQHGGGYAQPMQQGGGAMPGYAPPMQGGGMGYPPHQQQQQQPGGMWNGGGAPPHGGPGMHGGGHHRGPHPHGRGL